MRKLLFATTILAVAAFAAPAQAADPNMPKKAPVFSPAYPATYGFYIGLGTMGGGGSVSVTAPGVNANSLVSNQISFNGIVGYVWNLPNSQYFAAVEGWFGWQNFNGSAPGFSFTGPATFTQRIMVGAPLSDIAALFPNFPATVPPFPALPGGQTASNIKPYIAFDMFEDDITLNFFATGSNRDWRFSPGMSVGALGQLSSGSVVDVAATMKFPQKGLCAGTGLPGLQACGAESTQYLATLALKWL